MPTSARATRLAALLAAVLLAAPLPAPAEGGGRPGKYKPAFPSAEIRDLVVPFRTADGRGAGQLVLTVLVEVADAAAASEVVAQQQLLRDRMFQSPVTVLAPHAHSGDVELVKADVAAWARGLVGDRAVRVYVLSALAS